MENKFVNPYTFIEFPKTVRREPAPGHDPDRAAAQARYTGSFVVTWTLKSPMTLPANGEWGSAGGPVTIPGSSIKGAIRSVHETLFAGCPRVLDANFVPVYRQAMKPNLTQGWQLAVVSEASNGVGSAVRLCGEGVWIEATALRRLYESQDHLKAQPLPQAGDFVKATKLADRGASRGRKIATVAGTVTRVSNPTAAELDSRADQNLYALLVTDTSARAANKKCYWAAGKVGGTEKSISQDAWTEFARNVKTSRDRQGTCSDPYATVNWPPDGGDARRSRDPSRPIARRRRADGNLRVGDVIWVKVGSDEVEHIKLAVAWRHSSRSSGTMGSRVGVGACHTYKELCLSCAIFGSVDETGADRGLGQQHSYGGHVRFGAARCEYATGESGVPLAPMGVPHPGSGMFYLEHRELKNNKQGDLPTQWGVSPDPAPKAGSPSHGGAANGDPENRRIRGRKFYWHSDPAVQREAIGSDRFRKRADQSEEMSNRVDLVDTETILTQTITFDGLGALELQTLLAAFEPCRILKPQPDGYALHLGGGKPLGLGTASAVISQLRATTTADRYTANPTECGEELAAGHINRQQLADRVGDLTVIHEQAGQVMAVNGLGAWQAYVTYPTTRPWSEFGRPRSTFDESFTYFTNTSGEMQGRAKGFKPKPWGSLPLPTAADPRQNS